MKAESKTIQVETFIFNGKERMESEEQPQWIKIALANGAMMNRWGMTYEIEADRLRIITPEGIERADRNDYIVYDPANGSIHAYGPEKFFKTFDISWKAEAVPA